MGDDPQLGRRLELHEEGEGRDLPGKPQWQASSSSETVACWELAACESHVDT